MHKNENDIDKIFRQHLNEKPVTPPDFIWENLNNNVVGQLAGAAAKTTGIISFKFLAIVAVVCGLAGSITYFYFKEANTAAEANKSISETITPIDSTNISKPLGAANSDDSASGKNELQTIANPSEGNLNAGFTPGLAKTDNSSHQNNSTIEYPYIANENKTIKEKSNTFVQPESKANAKSPNATTDTEDYGNANSKNSVSKFDNENEKSTFSNESKQSNYAEGENNSPSLLPNIDITQTNDRLTTLTKERFEADQKKGTPVSQDPVKNNQQNSNGKVEINIIGYVKPISPTNKQALNELEIRKNDIYYDNLFKSSQPISRWSLMMAGSISFPDIRLHMDASEGLSQPYQNINNPISYVANSVIEAKAYALKGFLIYQAPLGWSIGLGLGMENTRLISEQRLTYQFEDLHDLTTTYYTPVGNLYFDEADLPIDIDTEEDELVPLNLRTEIFIKEYNLPILLQKRFRVRKNLFLDLNLQTNFTRYAIDGEAVFEIYQEEEEFGFEIIHTKPFGLSFIPGLFISKKVGNRFEFFGGPSYKLGLTDYGNETNYSSYLSALDISAGLKIKL